MNYHQYKEAEKNNIKDIHYWANKCRKIQKTLKYNPDPNATVRHHLRDTEEQRKYNDEHYELWGFEIDEGGNEHFEYGKYIIFVTPEEHSKLHEDSDETRHRKSIAGKLRWKNTSYRKHMTESIRKIWSSPHRRHQRSIAYSGNGNPFYGKHHSQATKEKYFNGKNNHMYGVSPSEETRKKISEANKGRIISDETRCKISNALMGHEVSAETRKKISEANTGKQCSEELKLYFSEKYTGKGNPFYGKHHSKETIEKISGKNNHMYGKHHTDETKKKISEANKNKVVSEETRAKLSKASSGERNGMYGKHPSEDTLNKMRNSNGVELQRKASIAYKKYKDDGGKMKWQDFRREFFINNK